MVTAVMHVSKQLFRSQLLVFALHLARLHVKSWHASLDTQHNTRSYSTPKQDQCLQAMRSLARFTVLCWHERMVPTRSKFSRLFYYLDCLWIHAGNQVRPCLHYNALQFNNLLCKRPLQIYEMNCTASWSIYWLQMCCSTELQLLYCNSWESDTGPRAS